MMNMMTGGHGKRLYFFIAMYDTVVVGTGARLTTS
jgi:hypothetical protein